MSLLQEARIGIQRQKAEAEEKRRKFEEDHRRFLEEEETRPERENAIRIEEKKQKVFNHKYVLNVLNYSVIM